MLSSERASGTREEDARGGERSGGGDTGWWSSLDQTRMLSIVDGSGWVPAVAAAACVGPSRRGTAGGAAWTCQAPGTPRCPCSDPWSGRSRCGWRYRHRPCAPRARECELARAFPSTRRRGSQAQELTAGSGAGARCGCGSGCTGAAEPWIGSRSVLVSPTYIAFDSPLEAPRPASPGHGSQELLNPIGRNLAICNLGVFSAEGRDKQKPRRFRAGAEFSLGGELRLRSRAGYGARPGHRRCCSCPRSRARQPRR